MAHLCVREQWMGKPRALDEAVMVAPSASFDLDVASVDEVAQDRMGRALRDPDAFGDVANPHVGFPRDAEQDVHVVGEESPRHVRKLNTLS